MTDQVELYLMGKEYPFARVASSFQPQEGEYVNLLGTTWRVVGRSFTIDDGQARMRCILIVRKAR
jgi:hypothetical protein